MFGWIRRIGRYLIITSRIYQKEVERRVDAERLLAEESTRAYDLVERVMETEKALEETSIELEVQKEERGYIGDKLAEVRFKKNQLERELRGYKTKKDNSVPVQAIRDMIETSQAPGLYLTKELIILYGNRASTKIFGKSPVGHGLWEFDVSEEEIELLKEKSRTSSKPFVYQLKKSILNHWMITPIQEEGRVLGYVLTNQRSFVKDLYSLLRSAIGEGEGVYIPKRKVIFSTKE